MTYAASSQLAMVLPLPVPPGAAEDAVRFINLEDYSRFFDDMQRGFPPRMLYAKSRGARSVAVAAPKLEVHDVGSFEASFVPSIADFDRLDERFRIPSSVWDRIPAYRDFGFAVFKLKATKASGFSGLLQRLVKHRPLPNGVHPMAFEFPRRDPILLYFPTLHVHDQQLHRDAMFDHTLYCQPDAGMNDYLEGWEKSAQVASDFMSVERTLGIVDPSMHCWRHFLSGRLQNKDAYVGATGTLPVAEPISVQVE